MADQFFGQSDPERLVAHLAAQASPTRVPRWVRWRLLAGLLTGLLAVLAVGGGLTAGVLTGRDDRPADRVEAQTLPTPATTRLPVAPQVTLAARPAARRTTAPPAPKVYVARATPTAAPKPKKSGPRLGQVGPNKPLKAPYDPDDHR